MIWHPSMEDLMHLKGKCPLIGESCNRKNRGNPFWYSISGLPDPNERIRTGRSIQSIIINSTAINPQMRSKCRKEASDFPKSLLASAAKYFEGLVAELRHQNGDFIHMTREDQSHLLALRDPPDRFIKSSLQSIGSVAGLPSLFTTERSSWPTHLS
jgi:hypothetical protein